MLSALFGTSEDFHFIEIVAVESFGNELPVEDVRVVSRN